MSNLFDLHSKPEKLDHYQHRHNIDPNELFAEHERRQLLADYDRNELKSKKMLFAKSAQAACKYAIRTKTPFPEGEAAIATSVRWSYEYAMYFRKRFRAGEPVIATNGEYAERYAMMVVKGKFPLGEKAIAKDAKTAFSYAKYLKKPFPAGEKAIGESDIYATRYAMAVLKGKFPEGEKTIFKDEDDKAAYLKMLDGP